MDVQNDGYTVIPFSKNRQIIADALALGQRKHNIHGLVEADVSRALQHIRECEAATGADISFTAFVVSCLGKAVDMHRHVQAYRGRNRLVVFDDVDVNTTIETEIDGEKVPILHIIRAVNRRGYADVSEEIRRVQAEGPASQAAQRLSYRFVTTMPSPVRRLFFKWVLSRPLWAKEQSGTVLLTSVGMFGQGGGWGVPFVQHTLAVTLGGIAEKPVVIDGRVEIREMLSVTVSFDHDIVDGAPAARFAECFKGLIEGGYGLSAQRSGRA